MAKFVTRDQLLGFGNARRYAVVSIPVLGDVRIRSLSELERSEYEVSNQNEEGRTDRESMRLAKCRLIALCVCDADGNPLFTLEDAKALHNLGAKDGAVTGLLFSRCWKHCGFSSEDIASILGNSETITDVASS